MPSAIRVVPIIRRKAQRQHDDRRISLDEVRKRVRCNQHDGHGDDDGDDHDRRCGVMPTAVMMLSTEKTRSRSRIWPMAAAKLLIAELAMKSSS